MLTYGAAELAWAVGMDVVTLVAAVPGFDMDYGSYEVQDVEGS